MTDVNTEYLSSAEFSAAASEADRIVQMYSAFSNVSKVLRAVAAAQTAAENAEPRLAELNTKIEKASKELYDTEDLLQTAKTELQDLQDAIKENTNQLIKQKEAIVQHTDARIKEQEKRYAEAAAELDKELLAKEEDIKSAETVLASLMDNIAKVREQAKAIVGN